MKNDLIVRSARRPDGRLSIVEVRSQDCTLSTGEVCSIHSDHLLGLVMAVCQEQAPIIVRLWMLSDGNELRWLHRVSENSTVSDMAKTLAKDSEVF